MDASRSVAAAAAVLARDEQDPDGQHGHRAEEDRQVDEHVPEVRERDGHAGLTAPPRTFASPLVTGSCTSPSTGMPAVVSRRRRPQLSAASHTAAIASSSRYAGVASQVAPPTASRWRIFLSRTNGRVKCAVAGTFFAGMAGSDGRYTGTARTPRPFSRRSIDFHLP